ncbi:MAG: RidA family protein [Ferrovibrio sp.]|uniref:RidA family protein n=1 Tax=Ferrovibrio sp. TaxID=1917215 RepID=UPI00260DE521|nr:RidA family protein [Ferrovibrio sp.]MCW0233390.1 RidA family protein [Ferrovibrio sp.]
MSHDARLAALKIDLPNPAAPAANYVPTVIAGNLLFVAGQITIFNGEVRHIGKLGAGLDVETGKQAARLCGLNIISQARNALGGSLDRIRRCVKVGGFVNCTPDFIDHPQVINGASDLMVEVFGDAGKHARFAVGAVSLPRGVAVEVDAIFEIA